MGMVVIKHKGNFEKTTKFLHHTRKLFDFEIRRELERCGEKGVAALQSATPIDTGKTAASWYYEVNKTDRGWEVNWCNRNVNEGVPIAIILQYGHGTNNGGYVEGIDYINPAIRPVFNSMVDNFWKEITEQ